MNRVSDLKKLPAWYSLAKYAPQQQLDLSGWLRQLAVRAEMVQSIEHGFNVPAAYFANIWRDPILTEKDELFDQCDGLTQLAGLISGEPWGRPAIRQATLHDHMREETNLRGALGDHMARLHQLCAPWCAEVDDEALAYWSLLDRPVDDWGQGALLASVKVDLGLPDELLVQAFREFLPRARETIAARSPLPGPATLKVDPAAWVRFSVLPYIDLKLWSVKENLKIPYRVYADAIFELGFGGDEVVRKTTTKLATEATKPGFIRKLAVAAANEALAD